MFAGRCTFSQKFLGFSPLVKHILRRLWILPTSLDLWPNWKCREYLPGDLSEALRSIQLLLIISGLAAPRATLQISIGSSKADTGIEAHVMLPRN